MTDKIDIANRLSDLLVRKGLNGARLAATCGVSESYVSRLLNAKTLPTAEFLIALARVHHVSSNWVLLGMGPRGLEAASTAEPPPRGSSAHDGVGAHPFDVADELRVLADRVAEMQSQPSPSSPIHELLDRVIDAGGSGVEFRVSGFLDGLLVGLEAVEQTQGTRSA